MQNFQVLGALPQTPVPPAAGGFAPSQAKQPPHCELLATRLCLNVIIFFPSLSVILSLLDVTKAVFLVNQNGGTSGRYEGTAPSLNEGTGWIHSVCF